jgi:hypothetical protein
MPAAISMPVVAIAIACSTVASSMMFPPRLGEYSRVGAYTSPSTCPFLRISDARQGREAVARGFASDGLRGRDDMAVH